VGGDGGDVPEGAEAADEAGEQRVGKEEDALGDDEDASGSRRRGGWRRWGGCGGSRGSYFLGLRTVDLLKWI
jgi:hypothetical protein